MVMETLPPGTVLHRRYRIERALGSGGFGHVYLAVDLQTNLQYAVKEYLVTGTGGQVQLQHEAHVLGQLHHPNLPAYSEAFDERGRYYVVLSYIEGSDLTDYMRIVRRSNEIIPLARIMNWILSICDAVSFLHSQQPPVIHRDIKPDNIRIMPNGTAMLVDLGNAKASADGARTLFFIRHQGTPGYAPLEQYPGGSGTDVRSDVYALGGTLYFALTAQEPPSVSTRNQAISQGVPDLPTLQELLANNPSEDSTETYASRQFRLGVSKPAKPAPRHSRHLAQLGTLPPPLLEQLNRIIKQAMAMKPKERYHSVVDFSNDLKKVLAALPTPTPPAETLHPVDPHSTQPDLPHLYETMQDAKGKSDSGPKNSAATSKPPGTTSGTLHCPRCNNELLPRAVYCPHCGTSLTSKFKKDITSPSPAVTNVPRNNALLQNKALAPRASAEQPRMNMAQTPVQTFPVNSAQSIPDNHPGRPQGSAIHLSHSQNMLSAPSESSNQSFMQGNSVQRAHTQVSQRPLTTKNAGSNPSTSVRKFPWLLVILAVILILLVLLLVYLLITLNAHPHP